MIELFFCWSGDRSNELATVLKDHLPAFIPGLASPGGENLFISNNIPKGSRWFDAVEERLEKADVGIVCITREGLQSGWIHFEAGALARSIRKKRAHGATLFTYLLGVRPDELTGPLAEFQSTTFDRDDTKRLCAAVVRMMGAKGVEVPGDWETAFNSNWPAFEERVKAVPPRPAADLIPGLEEMFRRKTFNEPIDECTRQSWIDRFTGARETLAALESRRPVMTADDTYLLDLYNELVSELDGYSMNMSALLLIETKFKLDAESGRLAVGKGIKQACEKRRGRIRQILTHLLAPNCAPVLEAESRRYAKMSSFAQRRTLLIDPTERELRGQVAKQKMLGKTELSDKVLQRCAASLWEFDRICFYLVQRHDESADVVGLIEAVEGEFETVRAVDGGGSLIPLHYALQALESKLPGLAAPDVASLTALLSKIGRVLDELRLDPGRQVRDTLETLQARLGAAPPADPAPPAFQGGAEGGRG